MALTSRSEGGRDPNLWVSLPGLCCQAAGGRAEWADPVAASWLLFYAAAHLMDSVEDGDAPDAWWAQGGPGLALNAATGLYFSACLALQKLSVRLAPEGARLSAAERVLRPFLVMSSGQYADFVGPPSGLDQYWQVAGAKSGSFFALACEAGASLAPGVSGELEEYRQYGLNLGLVIQILDDLADFRDLSEGRRTLTSQELERSLLTVYLTEVSSADLRRRFLDLLDRAATGEPVYGAIAEMIEQNGGVLYLQAELDLRRRQAIRALDQAGAREPARSKLEALIHVLIG